MTSLTQPAHCTMPRLIRILLSMEQNKKLSKSRTHFVFFSANILKQSQPFSYSEDEVSSCSAWRRVPDIRNGDVCCDFVLEGESQTSGMEMPLETLTSGAVIIFRSEADFSTEVTDEDFSFPSQDLLRLCGPVFHCGM